MKHRWLQPPIVDGLITMHPWPERGVLLTYLVGQRGYVKLGRTDDFVRRICELQTGNPNQLYLRGWVLGDREREIRAHLRRKHTILPEIILSPFRIVNSEWYVDNERTRRALYEVGFTEWIERVPTKKGRR